MNKRFIGVLTVLCLVCLYVYQITKENAASGVIFTPAGREFHKIEQKSARLDSFVKFSSQASRQTSSF